MRWIFLAYKLLDRSWPFAACSISSPDGLDMHFAKMDVPKGDAFLNPEFVAARPGAVQKILQPIPANP